MTKKGNISSFPKLPPERFIEFHNEFKGDGSWWQACAECGGECEEHKIGSLMPGEKEYIAKIADLPLSVFENQYLDCILTPSGNIEVLKLKPGCPFLDSQYRCAIRSAKVVLCDVYPIAFEVANNRVNFYLDPECPLSHDKNTARYFEQVGIPALGKLNAPVEWYAAVALFDSFNIDYKKIKHTRNNVSKYESFTLEQIMAARL
ncbi:MAG: YkgJ family cysteine cluster protein [Dehalococcoidia bacterium]|nr:YkgJ family cysteine cluster protein [Dehalococcoidia bacterium]